MPNNTLLHNMFLLVEQCCCGSQSEEGGEDEGEEGDEEVEVCINLDDEYCCTIGCPAVEVEDGDECPFVEELNFDECNCYQQSDDQTEESITEAIMVKRRKRCGRK
jgi:hypothetical protein